MPPRESNADYPMCEAQLTLIKGSAATTKPKTIHLAHGEIGTFGRGQKGFSDAEKCRHVVIDSTGVD